MHSPNIDGLWEAAIKRTQFYMTRILAKESLNYEEFSTVFNQNKSILNSSPLSHLTLSLNDLTLLTPAHFLIGRPLTQYQNRAMRKFQRKD